jgi:hypothetical protein
MTASLVQFLRDRLDERQAAASAAGGASGSWTALGTGVYSTATVNDDVPPIVTTGPEAGGSDEDVARAEHIALHDPERTLRGVQAQYATVDEYDIALWAQVDDDQAAYWQGHRDTLRAACLRLATAYSDHPDYQQEWQP